MAKLALNFNAMIDHLYKLVDSEGIKNIYTDKPAIRFLEKKSFAGKIYQQTHQDEVRHCTSGLQQKERYEFAQAHVCDMAIPFSESQGEF